jgi:Cytochrome c oxidase subunit IIa family
VTYPQQKAVRLVAGRDRSYTAKWGINTHRDESMTERTQAGFENVFEFELDAVMEEVPRGALALAGIAVLLLLVGWFFVYFAIFIPRGSVG